MSQECHSAYQPLTSG